MLFLFLDIDDVLTSSWSFKQSRSKKNWYNDKTYPFDPKCVTILNEILKLTEITIILSSSWRDHFTLQEIQDIFIWNKVDQVPIDYTPRILSETNEAIFNSSADMRDAEITKYINDNNVTDYIVLDDLPLKINPNRFIKCRMDEGLKQQGMLKKVTKLLKNLGY
jgi:hypothetical protein